ncbi:transglycosylase SLT domain-containing protein [Pediococcus acidilactici]|uniref:NlpC/P60 family protein n=1 Tax=Pediococcus acidilactici TaxID=1254 RepID=UPI001323377F|nr:NlpC/P60 family protein [Pediococcus acidilactici]KAF0365222.1 transglycosylase SLT domain-containing protein [Pediococcus acidilactici]KAF0369300.1 transglycosylase SLT domain-containing protein [Pediococcus acidilactici]KAF0417793.1 transglycosylase SLT domain-containing protein [Pediococcus acidilactici]KAF0420953.1 transglycosylase SLT domain-containing protein [Pediococcus acidilactici]KAF0474962.1 transglycosylase SLT domain-containing protein [Pediococcus acidilactici]
MAKKVVGREMTSRVSLDSAEAVKSLKQLTAEVKANTSGWKAQETALKSAGEYQKAAAARVDGLAKSMEMQKAKIDELKSRQSGLNRDTKSGEEAYLKLADQINKASRSYDSMGGQLDRAKSKLQYYNSGLADLQKGYKQITAVSESYVKRLEAEGRSAEANKARLSGLKQAYANMEAQYRAQTSELERIKNASGATSDAYKRQQVRVNETATSMAKLKSETNELDSALNKAKPTAFTRMLDSAKSKLGLVREEEKKTNDETKHFAIGAAIGNTISNAASSAIGYIKGVTKQGYELAEAGATIKKQWTNLGLSDSEATKMTAQIGDIRSKANMSGGAIDAMQKKFYAMTNSATKARSMTEVLTSYGSAAGKSGDQIASLTQGVSRLAGSSKVTASLFKRTFSQVPELQKAIIKASGMSTDAFNKQLAAGKITGSQLQGYMVKAAKTSGKAWEEFGDTTKGKMAAIQGTYTNLKVAFAKPLVSGIEKAIDGISEKKGALDNVKKSLTGLVGALGKKTGQYVGDVISFLVKNEKSIEKTGGAFASIVGSLAKGAWSAVAGALKLISGHSKDASKSMQGVASATAAIAKHKTAVENVGKAIMVYLAVSKLRAIGSTISSVAGGIGKVIGTMVRLAKSEKIATAAQWLFNAAMDANPIGIAVVALGALTAGLVLAYKHIKPFRDWVNKAFKSVVNFGKGIAKWGSNVGKSIGQALGNMSKKWNGFKKSFGKSWNSHWNAMGKSLRNSWNSSVKNTRNFFSTVGSKWNGFKNGFRKSWNSHWNTMTSNLHGAWNSSYKHTRDFFSGMGTKWAGWKKSWSRSWNNHWDTMRANLHNYWNKDLSHTRVFGRSMGDWLGGFKKAFSGGWSSLGTGVENIFKGLWSNLKKLARDGMNDVIDLINGGINAVDSVIHAFGGKRKTIGDLGHVHFATGTGVFSGSRNPITRPTMAMLNDGNDSPQTGNKEMVMLPNGDSGIVQGRNTKMMLPAGTEVLSASETAMLMSMQGVTKFAKGTGFFGDILNSVTSGISGVTSWVGKKVGSLEKFFKTATNIIAHPIKSLENLFSWSSKGISGVMSNIGHGLFNGVEKQAKTWWSTLWSMVDLDGAGDASGLLGAVEKYGKGKRYVWGAAGPDEFDCSGLVMYALKHSFGIDFPHFSGAQIAKTQHVSAANAKPGDLIGNNEHIGVYAGNGKYWSAMSPSSHPNIGMSSVSSFPGTPIYGRVRGISSGDDKGAKANSGLEKIIKSQVGGGFWKFISKLASMFGDDVGDPGGSGVERWKPDVKSALDKLGLSTSSSMIGRVLRQINTESGGNPKAMGGTDGLADGHAMGLMQVKPGTFSAYHLPGHDDIWNGYDNMLAGLNYAKHRYGSGLSFLGNGHGYENGGIIGRHGLYEIAEHNKPEMVLPLTNKSRANQLISQASQMVNGNNGSQVMPTDSESNKKLDKLISLMSAILGNMGNVQAVIAKSDVVNAVKSDSKTASQYSQMMGY